MEPNTNYRRLTQIKIALIVAIVLVLGAIVAIPLVRYLTTPTLVNFNLAPTTATVRINGTAYGLGIAELPAGDYTAEVSAAGFKPKQVSFTIHDHITTTVQEYLICSDGALNCYKSDTPSLSALETFTFSAPDQLFANFMNEYQKAKDAMKSLPLFEYYASSHNASASQSVTGLPSTVIQNGTSHPECPAGGLCLEISGTRRTKSAVDKVLDYYHFDTDFYHIIGIKN